MRRIQLLTLVGSALAFCMMTLALGADQSPSGRAADQNALKPYGSLVGEWRGTGQPQRQSRKDTWQETAQWAWSLTKSSAALDVKFDKGKYLKSARLKPAQEPGTFILEAVLADDIKRSFQGKAGERDKLVMVAEGDVTEGLKRLTLTPLHESRFLFLLETQDAESSQFIRLGEVGYTKQGVAFAAGDSHPVCIVTGGQGTLKVSHKGMTYYVCCTGCRDLFEEDSDGILAEAAKKAKSPGK